MARVGTIVHYRVAKDTVRPAMVVHIHSPGCVQLQVFVDGRNDINLDAGPNSGECAAGLMWRTSVIRGDGIGNWQYDMSEEVPMTQEEAMANQGAPPEDGATESGAPEAQDGQQEPNTPESTPEKAKA